MYEISVLMPYYNSEKYLDRLFESILTQEADSVQIICIDDGSEDDSFSVVESYKDKLKSGWDLLNLHISHAGQAAAISYGLPFIDSEIFTWIDSDDLLLPGFFSVRTLYFKEHPDYHMLRNNILVDRTEMNEGEELLFNNDLDWEMEESDLFIGMFSGEYSTAGSGIYTIRTKEFFDIYKDKCIPISEVGQNLQLILPTLSRLKCGYEKTPFYRYIQRADSHSNAGRNITEIIRRIDAVYRLLVGLIPYCDHDSEKLMAIAKGYQSRERAFYLKKAAIMNRKKP